MRTRVPSASATWQSTMLPRNVASTTRPGAEPAPSAAVAGIQPKVFGADRDLHRLARGYAQR
jgi:hypothetical protein